MIPKIGSYIERIEELDSTNSYASALLLKNNPPEGSVIIARRQIKGRGQVKNKWESEPYKNLTFSIIIYPSFIDINRQFEISKAISLGMKDFLSKYVNNTSIKWPNDIYIGKNKIAGILMEYSIQRNKISSCIIGIGLNINQIHFSSDAPNPVSLAQATGKDYNLEDCLSELLQCLDLRYQELIDSRFQKIDKEYENSLYQRNSWAAYSAEDNKFEGKIRGVDEYGLLIMETRENRLLKFDYKEVTFLS